MSDNVFIKLIRGTSHRFPRTFGNRTITKKKALGPLPKTDSLIAHCEARPRQFQVIKSVGKGPARRRGRRGGRGGSALPQTPVVKVITVDFGASISELMKLTRGKLIERIAEYQHEVQVRKSMSKRDVAKKIFEAEQEMLEEPDDEGTGEGDDSANELDDDPGADNDNDN